MPLMALGGLPLLVDGKLTDDPDCCCYVVPPPPACPPCCVQVNWGEFDETGDLIGTDEGVDIKLTMPTKFSRIVCQGESLGVAFGVPSPGSEATGGYIFFGPAWGSSGESPAPTKVFTRGLVDWIGVDARTFSASLAFSRCWLDTEAFLGYVTIGLDDPDWSFEIDISRCPSPSRCCAGPDCSPCCWEVLPVGPSPIYFDGKVWMVSETVSGYRLLISVDTDGPAGLYCSGEGVTVDFEIIPPRWDAFEEYEAGVTFQDPWALGSFSPAVNPVGGSVDDNSPPTGSGSIDWGPLPDTEYSLTLAADCADIYCGDYVLGAIAVNVTISESDSVSGTFGFTPCEEDNSECCCPPYCQCDCYWPLSKNFCEDALIDDQFGELYEIGGPTRLVDFLIEITADSDVFCGGTTDTAEIRQHGTAESKHFGVCSLVGTLLCARSNGLVIDIEDTSQTCIPLTPPHGRVRVGLGTSDCDPNLTISMDFVMPDGPFSSESIDAVLTGCNTISGTGTRTIGGVVFNWTISGTVEGGRACPCEVVP
jgi:hypothetical protein